MKAALQTPHRLRVILGTLALATALGGCLGEVSSPKRVYYALDYPRGRDVQIYGTPRYPSTVRIRRFESALAYDRQEIVYRSSPYEINYYAYRLWTAKPRKMLGKLVLSHLRQASLFTDVVDRVTDAVPEYDLHCEILAVEELNASKKEWYARLAMHFWLTRFEDGARVWQHEFDERRRVHERNPAFVVRALSEILEQQMRVAVDGLDVHLAEATKRPLPAGGRLQRLLGSANGNGGHTPDGGVGAVTEPDGAPAAAGDDKKEQKQPSARLKKKRP